MTDAMEIETMESSWTVIDGMKGIEIYPEFITIMEAIDDYGFDGICSIEIQHGWAARYSMPGYLDCTDWIGVFTDEDAAAQAAENIYGDDDE